MIDTDPETGSFCDLSPPSYEGVEIVEISPDQSPDNHMQAMNIADKIAENNPGQYMLLSWYDRDRDLESPRHSSECHVKGAVPGYVDYGLYHGATLKVNIENGRFVFLYMPVEI